MALHGKRVLVTREAAKAEEMAHIIRSRGAIPVLFPVLETKTADIEEAVSRLQSFDLVVLTSKNSAKALEGVAQKTGLSLSSVRFAVVGRVTADAICSAGAKNIFVPEKQNSQGLLEELVALGVKRSRVLILKAESGLDILAKGLRDAGAYVEEVVAYQTLVRHCDDQEIMSLLEGPTIDAALFMSPSAIDAFFKIIGDERALSFLAQALMVAIGHTTAAAIREKGLVPHIVPKAPSVEEALDLLEAAFQSSGSSGG